MIKLEIGQDYAGKPLSHCAIDNVPALQQFNLKKLFKSGEIKLNGSYIDKDYELEEGDLLELFLPIEMEPFPLLNIAYEDKNIIIVNKLPGLPVEPLPKQEGSNLLDVVTQHLQERGEYYAKLGYIPLVAMPLDVYTGGLVLIAKNAEIFDEVRRAVASRRIRRLFRAIVCGCPRYDLGELQHFYVRAGERCRMSDAKPAGGVPAYTRYEVLEAGRDFSVVEIDPVTLLPDQERAHMQVAGHPVLGDVKYGDARINKRVGIPYQILWATCIEFATGTGNVLGYLDTKAVHTNRYDFPFVDLG